MTKKSGDFTGTVYTATAATPSRLIPSRVSVGEPADREAGQAQDADQRRQAAEGQGHGEQQRAARGARASEAKRPREEQSKERGPTYLPAWRISPKLSFQDADAVVSLVFRLTQRLGPLRSVDRLVPRRGSRHQTTRLLPKKSIGTDFSRTIAVIIN